MALSITHATTVAAADDGTSAIGVDEWHQAHTLTGTISSTQIDLTMSPTWTGTHTFNATNFIFGNATAANGSISGFVPRIQNHGTTAITAHYSIYHWANDTNGAGFAYAKSRGGIGTHTIVQDGDGLGGLDFYGSDGTNFEQAARIKTWVDGTPGANSMPGRLDFWTTATGETSSVERMSIDSAGIVTVGSTASLGKLSLQTASTASAVTVQGSTAQTAAYTVTMPSSQGNASTFLQNNGSGTLSWAAASGASTSIVSRFFPADNEPPTANYATLDTRNSHPVLDFDDTTQESAIFTGVLPTNYASGGLGVKLAYSMTSTSTGTVGWTVEFERIGDSQLDIDSDSFNTALTITAVDIPATSGHVDVVTATTTSTGVLGGIAAGEQFRVRVKRDVANDNATGDAEFHWLALQEP